MMSVRFAKLGCNLVLWDVNKEGNEQTAQQVRAEGVAAHTYVVDLSNRDDTYRAADEVSNSKKLICICHWLGGEMGLSLCLNPAQGEYWIQTRVLI